MRFTWQVNEEDSALYSQLRMPCCLPGRFRWFWKRLFPIFPFCSEEKIEVAGALGKVDVQNRTLDTLERDLEDLYQRDQLDPFCLYVYGLVLADRYVLVSVF